MLLIVLYAEFCLSKNYYNIHILCKLRITAITTKRPTPICPYSFCRKLFCAKSKNYLLLGIPRGLNSAYFDW